MANLAPIRHPAPRRFRFSSPLFNLPSAWRAHSNAPIVGVGAPLLQHPSVEQLVWVFVLRNLNDVARIARRPAEIWRSEHVHRTG